MLLIVLTGFIVIQILVYMYRCHSDTGLYLFNKFLGGHTFRACEPSFKRGYNTIYHKTHLEIADRSSLEYFFHSFHKNGITQFLKMV